MRATTAGTIIFASYCAMVGFAVWWTHSALPMWALLILAGLRIRDGANVEAAELKALLRSLYWCAVNDTRVDPALEDAVRTVLGERPQEHGGDTPGNV